MEPFMDICDDDAVTVNMRRLTEGARSSRWSFEFGARHNEDLLASRLLPLRSALCCVPAVVKGG
jgi:hypothetical protein